VTVVILIVSPMTPYLPCHDGFRLIPAHLIRVLSQRHECHLIALSSGKESSEQLQWSQQYCSSVEILRASSPRGVLDRLVRLALSVPRQVADAVRARLRGLEPDLFHIEGPMLAPLARVAPPGMLTLLSAHDALSLRHQEFARFAPSVRSRAVHAARALIARRFERRWYGYADRILITSPADRDALSRSVSKERLTVIPNGVDLEYLAYRPEPTPGRIVFTGNMSWPPNEDAAEYFAREALPMIQKRYSRAEFWVVGAEPSPKVLALAGIPGVRVTGTVPDLREWIWSASVYVSPLRFGAGVKNKILEAMALGPPIVATPKSLTGTPLRHGRELLVAESAVEMAEAVLRLWGDDELRHSLSKNARRQVEIAYSWESIAERYEELCRQRRGTLPRTGRKS
jgi:glycosyltransferase involved in cell wall biosynthesis